jgi:glycosyltransferase involved in cell wall biosynthesis
MGAVTPRIDFALIQFLSHLSLGSIVMVGGVSGTSIPRRLTDAHSVYFLGHRAYERLPSCLKAFDACIICCDERDPFNVHCCPLKLYEYLAAAKPIVSTRLPAVLPFDGLERVAQDHASFANHVLGTLHEESHEMGHRRIEAGRRDSWQKRAAQMLQIVDAHLQVGAE